MRLPFGVWGIVFFLLVGCAGTEKMGSDDSREKTKDEVEEGYEENEKYK